MKKRYKKFTQEDFGNRIGIQQSRVSRLLNGQEEMSWPLAVVFADKFPERDVVGWKHCSVEALNDLFTRLKQEALDDTISE
jgi:transcriptional regulator with XRE-family HTH domain